MSLHYRSDVDLDFFKNLKDEDLNELVEILIKDTDGKKRYTQELTKEAGYKQFYPSHSKYWELIAAELQAFGANSIATLFRGGKGVLYKEIVSDISSKLKLDLNENDTIENMEQKILLYFIESYIDSTEGEVKRNILQEILKSENNENKKTKYILQEQLNNGCITQYDLALTAASLVTNNLAKNQAVNSSIKTVLFTGIFLFTPAAFAIPFGAITFLGAAYRVTFPAVILVAFLRQKCALDISNDILNEE